MTSQVARDSIGRLLERNTRRQLGIKADPSIRFGRFHLGSFAQGKQGKTHLGLSARTTAVHGPVAPDPDNPFGAAGVGELLIPSKPLSIAYANFDRDASTVVANLPEDAQIISEDFYLDEDGQPLLMPTVKQFKLMLERLHAFMEDSITAGVHLFFLDGGTILWEDVREATLPEPAGKDPDGNPHHLPRQYGPSNKEMRSQVMQRMYGLPMHTYITTEASAKWSSASSPEVDPVTGGDLLKLDGWKKTDHYVDCLIHMRTVLRSAGNTREATIPGVALKAGIIGQTFPNPTYEMLYRLNIGAPLLLEEDREEFLKLESKGVTY